MERVWVVDRHKCWGLIGLHNLTNVDWARKFVEITKTTWVGAFYNYDSAMHQLQHALCRYCTNMHQLFQISWWQYIPIKLVNGNCHSRSRVQSSLSATQQVPQILMVTGVLGSDNRLDCPHGYLFHKGHTDTMVYSVIEMTHVIALQHSSQGTSEPITPEVNNTHFRYLLLKYHQWNQHHRKPLIP